MFSGSSVSPLDRLVGSFGVHQDFFWFAALLLWSFALIAWGRSPRRSGRWSWLPWAAGAGIVSSLATFLVFDPPFNVFYERLVPGTTSNFVPAPIDPNVFGDVAIGAAYALMAAGWAWQVFGRSRRLAAGAFGGLALALILGQATSPEAAAWILALAPILLLWPLSRRVGAGAAAARPNPALLRVGAVVTAALVPMVSTIGPAAWALGMPQRHGPPTWFGVVFAIAQIVAAAAALLALLAERPRQIGAGHGAPNRREARRFALAGAAWLVAGVTFAIVTGRSEISEVRTNRLRTAAARAATFDPSLLAEIERLPGATSDEAAAIRRHLNRVLVETLRSTPFLQQARILLVRGDTVVILASAPAAREADLLRRRASRWEVEQFARGEPYNAYSPVPEQGAPYYCRAPLRVGASAPVAWLEYVREEFYSTMDRKWRTGPLLVTALGLIVGTFIVLQRRAARERAKAEQAALLAAEANRVKTAFLAKVSHELRTPLQSILGYTELLQSDPDSPKRADRLAALRQHGALMLRLVNDLLDLSAIEAGGFRFAARPVALRDLVAQTVESLRPRAMGKGLALACRVDPALPVWLETDPERWRQIVLNLVGNALKFTAAGSVDVDLSALERDAGTCLVELAVCDTGPGIRPEEQARLFQSFSRLELTAQHEGAGLGLALVAALCRAAGGEVTVVSDGRAGACFRVRMRLRTSAAPPDVPESENALSALAGRRVLVADDNVLLRELFAEHLAGCGAICDTVAEGTATVSAGASGGYDAIVVDLAMPGLDGFEVTRRLRAQRGANLRIVGVSAHAGAEDRRRAIEAGMDAFLAKPVPLSALIAALGNRSQGIAAGQPSVRSSRMAELFRGEAPAQVEAMLRARQDEEWNAMRVAAHWFRNSAIALDDNDFVAACAALEEAVERRDAAEVAKHWAATGAFVTRWLAAE